MSRCQFEFSVAGNHPSLEGHFPGNPVVPGVLLLDHVLQALHGLTGREVIHLKQVKFASVLLPGESACGCFDVNGEKFSFSVSAERRGAALRIASGAGILSPEATP